MQRWDAVVAGGGAAGLAAALTLARARRSVLVVDRGLQRNRFGPHSHGVLGFDGAPPAVLLDRGRDDVRRYGGVVQDGLLAAARSVGDGFALETDGAEVRCRALLVATGVVDRLPGVPGLQEQWGTGVVVCPYCDGWEHRDRRIGILATGAKSLEQAQLLRQWSPSVVLCTAGRVEPSAVERAALAARGVQVEAGEVEAVVAEGGRLRGLQVGGRLLELDVVFTAPQAVPNDDPLRALGAETEERPAGRFVRVDAEGATSVPRLRAAGNVVDPSAKVQTAAGRGMAAGAGLNEELVRQDVATALAASD